VAGAPHPGHFEGGRLLIRYVFKRILLLIPVIICVSFIVFVLMDMAPGDRVDIIIAGGQLSEEEILELRALYNLDRSVLYRFGIYMFRLVQGDLGRGDLSDISVWDLYLSRLPNTLALSAGALIIGVSISIPMGIRAAKRAGKITDNVTTTFSLVGMSMPSFWLGILLILVFSYYLGWLPVGGNRDGLRSFILPAICSGLMLMAFSTRQTRSSMLEVLNADYLRTARAKGVPEKTVINKHALGNAWIPIITTIGSTLSASLAGSAVVETVFAWPGVGRMTVEAVLARDVTTTTGAVIMTTIIYVLIQLAVDVTYAFVDPRIKSQYSSASKKKLLRAISAPKDGGIDSGERLAHVLSQETELSEVNVSRDSAAARQTESGGPVTSEQTGGTRPDADRPAILEPEQDEAKGRQYAASAASIENEKAGSQAKVTKTEASTEKQYKVKGADATCDEEPTAGLVPDGLVSRKYRKRSRIGEVVHHIRQNKGAMAGLIILSAMILTFLLSLLISFDSVTLMNVRAQFTAPNLQYLFGTDRAGRDMFLRVIYGSRYSLAIGFASAGIATMFGVFLGAIAGFYGKLADEIIMRFSDILASIPGILLGMVIVTVLGQSLRNLIIAVAVPAIPVFIRISRAAILSIRGNEFVEAARAVGLSSPRIVFTQVLPNGLAPIIVTFTTSLGMSIIVGASLSFLGFGVPVPHPEWGALISSGRDYIRTAPWLTTFPGIFIMVTVLAFNLLGDGLRDALDPKLKK
jgi:peptide/nickel transport system permease protein